MKIICDFYHDFLAFCRAELESFAYSTAGKTDEDVNRMFWNLFYRIPSMRPRKILSAKTFLCPSKLENGLKTLENAIIQGNSLKPYLSRRVDHIDDEQFYDNLLSDWNIHHFHLGTTMRSDGFVERTGSLLFATLDNDYFYEIAIMDHKDHWTEKELLETINANWPELTRIHMLHAISTRSNFSNDAIKKFRANGIQTLVSLTDGKVLIPAGGGYSTDGTPMDVIQNSDCMMIRLRNIQKVFEQLNYERIPDEYKTRKSLTITAKFSYENIFTPEFISS